MISFYYSHKKFLTAYSVCWALMLGMHFFILYEAGLPLYASLTDSLVSVLLLFLLVLAISNQLRFYRPSQRPYTYLLVCTVAVSVGWAELTKWLLTSVFLSGEHYEQFFDKTFYLRLAFGLIITVSNTLISWMWFNLEDQKEHEKRQLAAEQLAKEAELFKLRQQMQPHFLFNSLNSINALVVSEPEKARRMIQQLSDFLRGTLRKDEVKEVMLEEEMEHLHLYLEIEKVRFGYRLNSSIEIAEGSNELTLPVLLLQPVVENAIKFGLYGTTGEISIAIRAWEEEHNLVIQIINPFDPDMTYRSKGTGFGLSSIQRRLYLLYGRQDLVETKVNGQLFSTIIKIPQHDKGDTH